MRSRWTAISIALVVTAGLPASARGELPASRAEPRPPIVQPAPANDALLPLTPTAAQAGIIVVIADRHITLIRGDGTEIPLEGRLPADPSMAGDRRPLIRDGEAWISAGELAQFLGATREQPESARAVPASWPPGPPAFTAFEVPKPVVTPPTPPAPPRRQPRPLPKLEDASEQAFTWCDVSAADGTLSLSSITGINSSQMRGIYQEIVGPMSLLSGPQSRLLETGSPISRTLAYMLLETQQGSRQTTVGDMFDPLFGPATGIKVLSGQPDQRHIGAAVLVPRPLAGEAPEGKLELQGRTSVRQLAAEMQLAADGSYRALARWERNGSSLYSSLADLGGTRVTETGWNLQLRPSLTWYGLAAARGSDSKGSLVGLRWDLRRFHLALEQRRSLQSGEKDSANVASVLFHRQDLNAVIRYVLNTSGPGRSGPELSLSRTGRHGEQMCLSTSAPQAGEPRTYRISARWPLRNHLRAEVGLETDGSGLRPELKLEWRRSRDRLLSLRYGPLDTDLADRPSERALVFLMSIPLGEREPETHATGVIMGRVRDDSGAGVPDVRMILDGSEAAVSDPDGRYVFRDVDVGKHTVQLDPRALPANLGGDTSPRQISLSPGDERRADFTVTRLCQISGRVLVESPAVSYLVGLAGVVIELSTGAWTVTDELGRYQFAALPPQRYEVSLPSDRNLLGGLTPVSPMSWSFRLQPGDQANGADFRFLRPEREIHFDAVGG